MDALTQQNAIMEGTARYYEWKRKFLSDWQEAMMKGQIKQAFAMMPPEIKEMLKQQDPQGYERATTMLRVP